MSRSTPSRTTCTRCRRTARPTTWKYRSTASRLAILYQRAARPVFLSSFDRRPAPQAQEALARLAYRFFADLIEQRGARRCGAAGNALELALRPAAGRPEFGFPALRALRRDVANAHVRDGGNARSREEIWVAHPGFKRA